MILRLNRFLPYTRVEGPGERACIWVQGCSIRCSGCANQHMWKEIAGDEIEVSLLAEKIITGPKIEGVTFLGGEPFDQAEALALLGQTLKEQGMSVVTFTGYTLEDIQRSTKASWHNLLAVTDLLIDGPYRQDLSDTRRPWIGSSNQRYHFLTDRYNFLEAELMGIPNRIEIRLQKDGRLEVNGLATTKELSFILEEYLRQDK